MRPEVAATVLGVGAVLLPLMVLTGAGERRRGQGALVVVVAALFFPITWAVWYLRDEHPHRRTRRLPDGTHPVA